MSIADKCGHERCDRTRDLKKRSRWCSGHRWRKQNKMDMDKPFQSNLRGVSAYDNVMSKTRWQGDCLIFTGFIASNGYGRVETKSTGEIYAHRAVVEHHHGKSKLHVLHSCDNPRCVNINHLRYGTSRENMQDAKKRGRMARGAKNANTIMSEADVIKIASDRRISRVIAEEYNCSAKNVRNIKNGTTWGWLTGIKKSTQEHHHN